MAKRRTPWLQFDADFTQSPLAQVLCTADRLNGWRFVDLVSLARLCNAEGKIVSRIGSYAVPYNATLLHRRIVGDTEESYQAFLDLLLQMGVVTRADDGVLTLPAWEEWWGKIARTDAERQADLRNRRAQENSSQPSPLEEVGHAATGQPATLGPAPSLDTLADESRHCHADVTKLRDAPVTERHADVTPKSRISALHNNTEHDMTLQGSQNKDMSPDRPVLYPLGKKMSVSVPLAVPVQLTEMEFWDLFPVLYEHTINKPFTSSDRAFLEKKFRAREWSVHCADWAMRYLAFRYGARHLLGELRNIETGRREEPINSPYGFMAEMSKRYSPHACDEIERMRREVARGEEPRPPRFRKLEPIEC